MKQVTKTPAIIAQMQKIAGAGVDVANLPVWEAQAANTLPLVKRGSIYHKAQMSEGMVRDVATAVNANGLPLHTLHQQGSELPSGRVFMGDTVSNDVGLPETSLLFYVDPTDTDLISAIDNGIIDSVSIGVLPCCALCSECGFDYLGADASPSAFWDRTCPNDHTIGVDGCHLNLTGVDSLMEMSLVSNGAVPNSKITSGANSVVGQRLAASGLGSDAAILRASTAIPKPKPKEPLMADTLQLDSLVGKITESAVALAASQGNLAVASANVVTLTATVAEHVAEIATLKAAAADPAGMVAKLASAEAEVGVALTFLRAQAKKALVATEGDVSKLDTMATAELTAVIEGAQAKLSTLFPDGGRSKVVIELSADDNDAAARRKSFKIS
jgi:hypothetical protein